jgi:hypothetical protein
MAFGWQLQYARTTLVCEAWFVLAYDLHVDILAVFMLSQLP